MANQEWIFSKGVFGIKRKEEIELAWLNKAVQSNHRYDEKSFKEAVEWADRTMLARICEWLEKHDMTEHIRTIYTGTCSISFDKQGLIDALCKAMEE